MDDSDWLAHNPATGRLLGRVATTPAGEVAAIVERAGRAQKDWAKTSLGERAAAIDRWRRALAKDAAGWAEAVSLEVGKPRVEATTELVATLDAVKWTVKRGASVLRERRIGPRWQQWILLGSARVGWRPMGVVGMIGTWNYPLLLNAPPLAQALFAGNAVVWKPSESAALLGARLDASLSAAGLPEGLVATIQGRGDVGAALIDAGIDKCVFTGGVANGRRVLGELGSRGIPAVAELSGFDAAIVLADAPLESTAHALAWASFVGAGQTCVAVKRVLVVGDPVPLAEALAARASSLRVGDPAAGEVDVGPLISERARDQFHAVIQAAVAAGARIVAGGKARDGAGWFYEPTVLLAPDARAETALCGCFGPVVVVRGVGAADEAVDAVNATAYGLSASVWSRDRGVARALARRLEAGMVSINDAVTPSAHAGAPFGGVKSSGYGRTRGEFGLREFAQPQSLQTHAPGGFRPQLFPYGKRLARLMDLYIRFVHGG